MIVKRALALALCGSVSLAACAPAYATTSPGTRPPLRCRSRRRLLRPHRKPRTKCSSWSLRIALYPDSLVAQILAASTYPAEVVEAQRWIAQHHSLHGKQLADQVNTQSWDPSVKALTAFPSVLANMNSNLSWTSALGEAYVKDPQDVMNTVQDLRQRAEQAGNLRSTPQQTVSTQGQQIVIEPSDPDVVYVPQYDPWLAYGPPLVAWPSWYRYRDSIRKVQASPLASVSGSASSPALAGDGTTGASTGAAMRCCSIIVPSSRAMRGSSIIGLPSITSSAEDSITSAARPFRRIHFAGGYHHFGGVQHFASAAHFGGFHGGGFHGGGFHGGGFHGGGHGGRR